MEQDTPHPRSQTVGVFVFDAPRSLFFRSCNTRLPDQKPFCFLFTLRVSRGTCGASDALRLSLVGKTLKSPDLLPIKPHEPSTTQPGRRGDPIRETPGPEPQQEVGLLKNAPKTGFLYRFSQLEAAQRQRLTGHIPNSGRGRINQTGPAESSRNRTSGGDENKQGGAECGPEVT